MLPARTVPYVAILGAALIPVAATVLGAVVAAVRPPSARIRSYVQHFAAGVVFSIVAGELLADLTRIHAVGEIVSGFALGIAVMLVVRSLGRRLEGTPTATGPRRDTGGESKAARRRVPVGLLVTVGIDVVVDGLLLGLAFGAGGRTGALLTFALSVEVLSLGLAVTTTLLATGGVSRVRGALTATGLALLLFPAALGGAAVLAAVSETALAAALAFGAAALLFLVTEELLVEAHEVPETPVATVMFFLGFLTLYVIELLSSPRPS